MAQGECGLTQGQLSLGLMQKVACGGTHVVRALLQASRLDKSANGTGIVTLGVAMRALGLRIKGLRAQGGLGRRFGRRRAGAQQQTCQQSQIGPPWPCQFKVLHEQSPVVDRCRP